jgi:putative ABC transport system substrate-binding protein
MRLAAAALAAFAALFPGSAESFEVLVVKNADLKPYEDVLRGVRDACGCRVREVTLSGEEGSEKILQTRADAIVVIGTTVFKKAKAIRHLPLIFTMVMPSEAEQSLQPNISGVSMDLSPASYLGAIKEVFPKAKRIGLLYDPRQTGPFVEEAANAARSANVTLLTRTVSDTPKIPALLEEMRKAVDVFWMIPDTTVVTTESVEYFLRFSFQHNLPIFSFSKKYVEMGAVAALDIDPYDMGTQAGEIVKQLSQGRSEAVRVYARSFHLTVNRKVAENMGIALGNQTTRRNP